MITTLHIKNIGIIDDICVDFNKGFNVLTGETGAGKTLIMDSLAIIAGGRFSKEMIRKGEEHSFVEISLYEPEDENAIEGNIIVSREIYANGRNTCKINGRLVTVAELKHFMQKRLDIHGQHDNQTILNPAKHIIYLDKIIGNKIKSKKNKYQELLLEYHNIQAELKKNYGDDKEKQRKLDLLEYQKNEIEQANLKIKEDEELEEKRRITLNAEKISKSLSQAEGGLKEKVIEGLGIAIHSLEKISNLDKNYQEGLENLKAVYYDVEEITIDIRERQMDIDFDEQKTNEIEERLDMINTLKRKYGNNIEEILNYQTQLEEEIKTIENLEEYTNELKEKLEEIKEKMFEISKEMSGLRKEYAKQLEQKVNQELRELEMKQASFKVEIIFSKEQEYNQNGLDQVQFLITTNIGEEYKPLVKIASGGEISRIMLAIKTVLSDVDEVQTMVFDEIDTGISGIAAKAVSKKMKEIAKKHQIFVVTHLAVIVASSDYHFFITKETNQQETKTKIRQLTEYDSICEIARISTGEVTETAIKHARELKLCS